MDHVMQYWVSVIYGTGHAQKPSAHDVVRSGIDSKYGEVAAHLSASEPGKKVLPKQISTSPVHKDYKIFQSEGSVRCTGLEF
jgi:hypothetical protein